MGGKRKMYIVKLQFRSEAKRNWQVEQSRAAEGAMPRSLLRNMFPKLALGFIPVTLLSPDLLVLSKAAIGAGAYAPVHCSQTVFINHKQAYKKIRYLNRS
jgi:hypothetical protein